TEALSRGLPRGFDWINQNQSLLPHERVGLKTALLLAGLSGFLPVGRRMKNQISLPTAMTMIRGVDQALSKIPQAVNLFYRIWGETLGNENWIIEKIIYAAPDFLSNTLDGILDAMIAAPSFGVKTAKYVATGLKHTGTKLNNLYDTSH